jgi:hypothetical protein
MVILLCGLLAVAAVGAQPRQSVQDVRDVLAAVLGAIEPDGDDTLLLGRGLDASATAALRTLVPRVLSQPDTVNSFPLAANAILIDSVAISGPRAVVRLTVGPVPATMTWACGQVITMPLRKAAGWEVLEDEARVRCAVPGPRGLPFDRERLLEAARLAFSYIELDASVRIVASSSLSAEGLASLRAIADVPAGTRFETETMRLPARVFAVSTLSLDADGVDFSGTLGPVPKHATLACGTTWNMRIRQHANGWSFETASITVC